MKSGIIRWRRYTVVLLSVGLLVFIAVRFGGDLMMTSWQRQLSAMGIDLRLPESVDWQGRTLRLQSFGINSGIDVQSLSVTFRLPGDGELLRHPFAAVTAEGVTIAISEGVDGVWRLPGLFSAGFLGGAEGTGAADAQRQTAFLSPALLAALPVISVRDLHLVITSHSSRQQLAVENCTLVPGSDGWHLSLAGQVSLVNQSGLAASGAVQLAATLVAPGKVFSSVSVAATDFSVSLPTQKIVCRLPRFLLSANGVTVDALGRFSVVDIHGELAGASVRGKTGVVVEDLTVALGLAGLQSTVLPFVDSAESATKWPVLESGELRVNGVAISECKDVMRASLVVAAKELSAISSAGGLDLQGEALLDGPSLCQPLRVALKGGAGRGSSLHGASRLDIEIQKDGEGVSSALFQLLVETTADLGEFFKKAERGETLPLSMSALLDLPPVDTLMNRVPETLSPLPIQASLSGQGTVSFRGGQWQSHGQWQGNVVGGPVRGDMAVTTELAFGAGGARIEVAGSGKAPPFAVTVRDLLLGEALVSGAVALAEDEDHRLLVASWEGKSLSLQSEAKVRLDEPLLVAFPAEPLRRLELSGNMQLAGQLQGGVVRLTSKPKVRLVGQNGETTATLGLAGELVGAGGGDVEDFVWRLGGTGLEFVVDGHGPRGRLLQPARFRLENGNDAGLLRLRSGVPSFSGRLSSLGPRLDLAVGDNRFVVKNDALSLAVKGEGGRAMAVELAVRELLAPEQFIVAEGLRFVLVFDTARGLIDKMDLMLDRLHDATEVRRFADCNFWAQLRGKGNRLVGDGAFAIHNSDSDPLAWPLHFDLAGDGRSGRVVLAANDFSLAPGSINLKNLFPVVAGAVNSVVASCDVRGELSWDAARGEGVIDSRLKVSDFDIDLAPPELPGEKLRLIGGDIVIFFKAPVSALSTGRLVTHVDAVTLITPQFALFGVQGLDLHAEPVWPLYTPEPLVITFDELSGFLPFDDGKLSFAVTNGREIALREMGMHLAGGMVSALPMTIDLANPKGELRLAVHGVQLAELREKLQISLKDHLQVTGELDGVLPIEFSSDGIRLQGAVLEAKRPGLLRYRPGDAQDWRYKTGKSTLQVALSDLRYDSFRLALSGDLGEAVTVDLHTEGTNPELVGGMPIDLTLKIHAELEKLLSAYNSSVGGTERSYAVVE